MANLVATIIGAKDFIGKRRRRKKRKKKSGTTLDVNRPVWKA